MQESMAKSRIVLAGLLLALLLPLAPGLAGAQGEGQKATASIHATITPSNASVSLRLEIPVGSGNLTSLEGVGSLEGDCNGFDATLNLTGYSPLLENAEGFLHAAYYSTLSYDPETNTSTVRHLARVNGSLSAYDPVNQSSFEASVVGEQRGNTTVNLDTRSGVETSTSNLTLHIYAESPNGTITLDLAVNASDESSFTPGEVVGQGSYEGSIYVLLSGGFDYSFQADFSGDYEYTLNTSNGTIVLSSMTIFNLPSYQDAYAFYMALSMIVSQLNLTDYVTVYPPGFGQTTVKVEIEYEGTVNMSLPGLPGAFPGAPGMFPGLPFTGQGPLANLSLLLPEELQQEGYSADVDALLDASVSDGAFTVTASLHVWVNATLPVCPSLGGTATITYSPESSTVVVEASLNATGLSEPFTAFQAVKSLVKSAARSENISYTATLEAGGGVVFLVGGEEKTSVTLEDAGCDVVEGIALRYGNATFTNITKPLAAQAGAHVVPPTMLAGITVDGFGSITLAPPYNATIAGANLTVTFTASTGQSVNVSLLTGARITGSTIIAALPTGEVSLPENITGTPAGPAVVVRNASGMVALEIPVDTSLQGEMALVIIHENGSITVLHNLTITGGILHATVPTTSTYIPVALQAGGEQPSEEENTTTTTSPGETETETGTTTSPPETGTTTTPPSTGTNTTSPPEGEETTTPPETESPTTTTTSPTGTETGTETPEETPQQATTPGEKAEGVNTTLIAAGIIIIILLAAAYLLTRR